MEHSQVFGLSEELNQLYIIDDIPDIPIGGVDNDDEDDVDEDEPASTRKYDDKTAGEIEKYSKKFEIPTSGVYMDEDENSMKMEYDVFYEEMFPEDMGRIKEDYSEDPEYKTEFNFPQEDSHDGVYPDISRGTESQLMENASYRKGILSIEYEKPDMINGQKTYQRIAFEAKEDGDVYGLTIMNFDEAGIEFSSEYDGEFDSRLLTSINNKTEGSDGNFNEFYLNGEIGGNAADMQKVKKGDIIEWRYAEETDGSCGGVPDYEQIKSLLVYNVVVKDGLPLSFNPNNMYAA